MSGKPEIRKAVKAATLKLIESGLAALQEPGIWTEVETLPGFAQARTLLLYSSLPDEVSTLSFIKRWQDYKRIVLPVVDGDHLTLKALPHGNSAAALIPGYMGILEPGPDAETVCADAIDFAVIPGVAFTAPSGSAAPIYRLGRGKGFYDRLLGQLHCPTVGVGFSTQQVSELPVDEWDQALSHLVIGRHIGLSARII